MVILVSELNGSPNCNIDHYTSIGFANAFRQLDYPLLLTEIRDNTRKIATILNKSKNKKFFKSNYGPGKRQNN